MHRLVRRRTGIAIDADVKAVRVELSKVPVAHLLAIHNVSADEADLVAAEILLALFRAGRP